MRIRLGIWFEVRDDARFLSHRDMLRWMERAAARAELPLRFSQGFNPRPKLSLPLPRPVGIASEAELLVLELAEPVAPATALDRLGPQMPPGVTLTGAADLEPGPPPQPLWVHYRLDIDEPRRASLAGRLAQLADHPQWLQRREGHKKPSAVGELDLKPLVEALTIEGRTLHMRLAPRDQVWARVDEVLELLGLDARLDRARLVRLAVHWDGAPDQPPAQSRSTE